VLSLFYECLREHGQDETRERRRHHGGVDQVVDPGMEPAPARTEMAFEC